MAETDFKIEPFHHLYDADTGEDLGPATPHQVRVSDAASERDGGCGFFIMGREGEKVGFAERALPGERKVYTSVPWYKTPLT